MSVFTSFFFSFFILVLHLVRYAERERTDQYQNFLTVGQRRRRRRLARYGPFFHPLLIRFHSFSLYLVLFFVSFLLLFLFLFFWSIGLCLWVDLVLPSCDERVARGGGVVCLPLVAAGLPILQLIWIEESERWETEFRIVRTRLHRLSLVISNKFHYRNSQRRRMN